MIYLCLINTCNTWGSLKRGKSRRNRKQNSFNLRTNEAKKFNLHVGFAFVVDVVVIVW